MRERPQGDEISKQAAQSCSTEYATGVSVKQQNVRPDDAQIACSHICRIFNLEMTSRITIATRQNGKMWGSTYTTITWKGMACMSSIEYKVSIDHLYQIPSIQTLFPSAEPSHNRCEPFSIYHQQQVCRIQQIKASWTMSSTRGQRQPGPEILDSPAPFS